MLCSNKCCGQNQQGPALVKHQLLTEAASWAHVNLQREADHEICSLQNTCACLLWNGGVRLHLEVPGAALGRELCQGAFCVALLTPQAALPNCFPNVVSVEVLGFSVLTSQTIKPFL